MNRFVLFFNASLYFWRFTPIACSFSPFFDCYSSHKFQHVKSKPNCVVRHQLKWENMSFVTFLFNRFLNHLVYVVDVGSLVGPVVVALLHSILRQRGQHDDDDAAALPHHLHARKETPISHTLR